MCAIRAARTCAAAREKIRDCMRSYLEWVMRLVLPVVAAWIGLQYTLFSLGNLCDNGSAAIWCQQPTASAEARNRAPEESPVEEDVPPKTPEEAVLPAENGQPEPDENAPKEGDILYHSV